MRVLFVAAECAPLVQSGGLGDAVSGLARALGALGHDVTVFIPGHRPVLRERHTWRNEGDIRVRQPTGDVVGTVLRKALFPGVAIEAFDAPQLFDRPGVYGEGGGDYGDNPQRFIAFARAAAYRTEAIVPDVVVAHDWHAGLVLPLLRTSLDRGRVRGIGTVQVVHNNAHQGRIDASLLPLTGLSADLLHVDGLEAWDSLCLLKAGVMWADRVVAVSKTYAKEITTPAFGEGLDGAYRNRAHRLIGIENGIDTVRFDPATDRALPLSFDALRTDGKRTCHHVLLEQCGLDAVAEGEGLVLGAVGRLAEQKGWDVLIAAADRLVQNGHRLVCLGDGAPWMVEALHALAARHPRRIYFRAGFDDGMARRIYAGSDALLVPSRFEPCGLVQLIAQRYGTLPIAHATGGLVDTLTDPGFGHDVDDNDVLQHATGVLFAPLSPLHLCTAVERAAVLRQSPAWPLLVSRLMRIDVSFAKPALLWLETLREVASSARQRL